MAFVLFSVLHSHSLDPQMPNAKNVSVFESAMIVEPF